MTICLDVDAALEILAALPAWSWLVAYAAAAYLAVYWKAPAIYRALREEPSTDAGAVFVALFLFAPLTLPFVAAVGRAVKGGKP